MMFPLPNNMEFKTWCAQLQNSGGNLVIPNPLEEKHWWDWAINLKNLNPKANIPLPRKASYPKVEDWKRWGMFFINNVKSR